MGFSYWQSLLAWIKNNRGILSPMERRLAIEDDKRLWTSLGSSGGLGTMGIAFLLSLPVAIQVLPDDSDEDTVIKPKTDTVTVILKPYHGKSTKIVKHPKVKPNAGAPAYSQTPKSPLGVLKTSELTSRTNNALLNAYQLTQQAFRDVPKLSMVGVVKREGQSRFSGRPGRMSTEFNPQYDIHDGNSDADLSPTNDGVERITPSTSTKPETPAFGSHEITRDQETGQRSTASILAVVKSHAPGLRHLYNQHLRTHPGLQGKVTVRFSIDARGTVVHVALLGTTTGDGEFEQAILQALKSWRFEPVRQLGVDEVTVPLQFSE